jgi:hypothetical protein
MGGYQCRKSGKFCDVEQNKVRLNCWPPPTLEVDRDLAYVHFSTDLAHGLGRPNDYHYPYPYPYPYPFELPTEARYGVGN